MSSDSGDPKNKPRHSSGNDLVEPSPFLLLCLLFHPFIPPILLLQLALPTSMLYPYPYLSIHSTLCDTHDSSQLLPPLTSSYRTSDLIEVPYDGFECRHPKCHLGKLILKPILFLILTKSARHIVNPEI